MTCFYDLYTYIIPQNTHIVYPWFGNGVLIRHRLRRFAFSWGFISRLSEKLLRWSKLSPIPAASPGIGKIHISLFSIRCNNVHKRVSIFNGRQLGYHYPEHGFMQRKLQVWANWRKVKFLCYYREYHTTASTSVWSLKWISCTPGFLFLLKLKLSIYPLSRW